MDALLKELIQRKQAKEAELRFSKCPNACRELQNEIIELNNKIAKLKKNENKQIIKK